MNMECVIYMGKEDCERQALNVFRMELLGAKVVPVSSGTGTLKDAVNEALRVWTERVEDTYYVLGSVMGPHPYPEIVRDFQKIIGEEIKAQMLEKEGRLPDVLVACVAAAPMLWVCSMTYRGQGRALNRRRGCRPGRR